MSVDRSWFVQIYNVFIVFLVGFLHIDRLSPRHVYATNLQLSPMWPVCKVGDGPVRVDHGRRVTWVSCVCQGNGTCSLDVDRLLNAASLFPRHYNVINVTCASAKSELVWTSNKPIDVIQDVVIKDCKLAKNTTLFAVKSPLEELWLDNLGNEISKSMFQGIENLESLLITKHKHDIQMDFLTELPYLKHLTINEAGLASIPMELMDHSLLYLDFNHNSITHEGLPNIMSTDLKYAMEDLYLDHNQISNLSNYSFNGGIKYLFLSNNRLHTVSNLTFTNMKILRELDISNNELESMPSGVFGDLYYLSSINVANNKLTHVPADLLTGLQSLKHINMGGNKLAKLSNDVFHSNLNNLMSVNLRENEFDAMPSQVLKLPGVTSIDLSRNKIQINNIQDMFINQENPFWKIVVNLANNSISNIPVDWFNSSSTSDLHKLMKKVFYVLDGNDFNCDCNLYGFYRLIHDLQNETLQIWNADKYRDSVVCGAPFAMKGRSLFSASEEDLKCPVSTNCPTNCDCHKFFNKDGSVTSIVNCSNANIKSLPELLPSGTSELYVDHNRITALEMRPYLSDLNILSVTHNNITSLDEKITEVLSNVKTLSLEYNNITYLPNSFKNLNISNISLHHNPLVCDCHTLWMKTWILQREKNFSHLGETCCTVPPGDDQHNNKSHVPVMEVRQAEFICSTPAAVVSRAIASSHMSIIIVVMMVMVAVVMSSVGGALFYKRKRRQRQDQQYVITCSGCPNKTVQCIKTQAACAAVCDIEDLATSDTQPLTLI